MFKFFTTVKLFLGLIFLSVVLTTAVWGADFQAKFNLGLAYAEVNSDSVYNRDNYLNLKRNYQSLEFVPRYWTGLDANDTRHVFWSGYGWVSPQGAVLWDSAQQTVGGEHAAFRINELYYDYQHSERLYFLVGLRKESWGNGFFWNPANIIDPEVSYDYYAEYQNGQLMLKEEIYLENMDLSIYAIPLFATGGKLVPVGLEGAARAHWLWSGIDLNCGIIQTLARATTIDNKSALSAWASYAFPFNLTLSGEGLLAFVNNRQYPSDSNLTVNTDRQNQAVFSMLLSMAYQLPYQNMIVRGEYYHNGYGYTQEERVNLIDGLQNKYSLADYTSVAAWTAEYGSYLLSKNFIGLNFIYPEIGQVFDYLFRVTYALDDHSVIAYTSTTYHFADEVDFYGGFQLNTGKDIYSEYYQQMERFRFTLGATYYY